ncbi:hypothetical protein GIB67_036187 [Kingdonia uniflora]|uniref:Uncharacterized protein n=1 Tax=Kingdonia uniflora TaxID=39325 RepID=A0A7J7N9B1_9MAGN|nr:hypothetical protein GIB67_036187 [Kingdonia uniflora]
MVKTRSQRAVEACALNDLRLAFKIDEIRKAVFGQQGYDAVMLETRVNYEGKTDVEKGEEMSRVEEIINEDRDIASGLLKACGVVGHTGCFKYEQTAQLRNRGQLIGKLQTASGSGKGGKDKRKAVTRSLNCKLLEEAEIEEVLKKLQKLCKLVRTNAADSHSGVEDLVGHLSPVIGVGDEEDTVAELVEWPRLKGSRVEYPTVIIVCETLNERWAASGSERRITAKDFLEYYAWSDEEPLGLNNRTISKGISCKVSRKEFFIDTVAKEGAELKVVLKELRISRFKRVASKDDKVRRSQAKRRMAEKTPGSMEEKLLTPELNTPLKLVRLSDIPDRPVDMATFSSTVVRNLAKRNVVVSEESDKIAEGADLRPRFEVEAGLLEEQCRAKAREKMAAVVDDEFKMLELEKEREDDALKLKQVRAKSVAEAERLVTASATSRNNFAGKLYQLRYTKAEILAFSKGNYEVKEIVDKEEVEEMEDGLNVVKTTTADNQETIDQEIASSRLRVVDLEGLLEVEKKSSVEL